MPTAEEMERAVQEAHRRKQMEQQAPLPFEPKLKAVVGGKAGEILDHLYPDEPVFVFRAKDILSVFALDEYARIVEKYDAHGPQIQSIVDRANDFRAWQKANPDKVKLPD